MGSAPLTATALSVPTQFPVVGSSYPYNALQSGLNKTDASFASLVRQTLVLDRLLTTWNPEADVLHYI
ncbi:hypothetical protein IAQ61_002973 [Plenodomus lingam]|uniref:uncharacterized protein n=1 Tax=Leptosphaeria maculans TaxID=5022 RepID=UPI003322B92A|nr:hypothetical protein IAQ61_002973 [Plenodomus lingam]